MSNEKAPKHASVLTNWTVLNTELMKYKEQDIWSLLKYEQSTKRRHQIMLRLHARANRLRAMRERRELLNT